MRTIPRLRQLVFFLIVGATGAAAAPEQDSDSSSNPNSQLDPDGIPLSITRIQQKAPTQAEIDEYHRQQELALQDKNWLLRGYEQQQQLHNGGSSPAQQSTNLYLQLTSNKALAKLAGLSDAEAESAGLKTGADPGANGAGLRKDSSTQVSQDLPSVTTLSKPLIVPLSATATLAPYSAPAPLALTSPYGSILPQSSDNAAEVSKAQAAADLDTPGMTAAKKDPAGDMTSADLTLDILPGETVDQAKAHQDNFKAELALPMDAQQLHQQETTAMNPPVAKKATTDSTAQTTTPPPTKTPQDDPNAPTPVSKMPIINPVRPGVPNPFDILNR